MSLISFHDPAVLLIVMTMLQPSEHVVKDFNIMLLHVSALMYSVFGTVIGKVRGVEDELNTLTAGTLTGLLFKASGKSIPFLQFSDKTI